ncbi:MAG: ribosome maturation factor RimP [Candidatus Cyclobacteriaceae bacterium M2_1C_046]
MDEIKEKIEELVNLHLKDNDLFLVDIGVAGGKSVRKITVLVDSDQGVSIDECAKLSRRLSQDLEEQELIEGAYTIDISSPGLDQPLRLKRQYLKNIGRKVKVITNEGAEIKGTLKAVDDEAIVVEKIPTKKRPQKEEDKINFEQIKHTTVLISFK